MTNLLRLSSHPDIARFLLLDDPANELFLSAGLGADRIPFPFRPSAALRKSRISVSQLVALKHSWFTPRNSVQKSWAIWDFTF